VVVLGLKRRGPLLYFQEALQGRTRLRETYPSLPAVSMGIDPCQHNTGGAPAWFEWTPHHGAKEDGMQEFFRSVALFLRDVPDSEGCSFLVFMVVVAAVWLFA
jgi:hypothetical protein